jgi:hypothetical protein
MRHLTRAAIYTNVFGAIRRPPAPGTGGITQTRPQKCHVLMHGSQLGMSCARRSSLEQRYRQACAAYDTARKRLHERFSADASGEFLGMSDQVDRAADLVAHARAALEAHIRQHCCLAQGEASPTQE